MTSRSTPSPQVVVKLQRFHDYALTLQEYCDAGNGIQYPEIFGCPQAECIFEGRLYRHGYYWRSAVDRCIECRLRIPRYICPRCGHTASILPSFLHPYIVHSIELVWQAVTDCVTTPIGKVIERLKEVVPAFSRQHLELYMKRLTGRRALHALCLAELGVPVTPSPRESLPHWADKVTRAGGIIFFNQSFSRVFSPVFMLSP